VYVFTRNAKRPSDQNVEFISSDIAGFVRKLTRLKGKDIWIVGGADIVSILLNAGLVHGMILSVHATVLGTGTPIFKGIERQAEMKLTRSISYESGLVQLHYEL